MAAFAREREALDLNLVLHAYLRERRPGGATETASVYRVSMLRIMRPFTVIALALALLSLACAEPPDGRLEIRIVDGAGGKLVPARVELLDQAGKPWVPVHALPLRFECIAAPPSEWAEGMVLSDTIPFQPAGAEHFYIEGEAALSLPPGRYRLRVFRGIEVRVAEQQIDISPGQEVVAEVALERWADMASEGWFSVDDHVHITRRNHTDDATIGAWMQAEDLRVVNLLQMGTVDQFDVTPQRDFGDAGAYRSGDTLLLAGQEHPRTHFLGHTITLGAKEPVDQRDTYIDYETTFREGARLGGVSGYAHWGIGPARTGLAVDAPRGLVSFLEVLQFEFPWYDEWYDLLDLGVRMTPTAGTDFPCGPLAGVPGRERFYAALDAPPTRASLVRAVREGRTFVTNGPLLDLRLGQARIGDEITLAAPAQLRASGRVRFDPTRDDLKHVEIVVNGEARPLAVDAVAPGDLRFDEDLEIAESSWVALRVRGDKVGETLIPPRLDGLIPWFFDHAFDFREANQRAEDFYESRARVRPSAAHTAAIFVTVTGSAPSERALARIGEALARLDDLEARLADDRIADQTLWDWIPYADAVPEAHLRRNRPALLRAIQQARDRYAELRER
jgi:hypothetical protein